VPGGGPAPEAAALADRTGVTVASAHGAIDLWGDDAARYVEGLSAEDRAPVAGSAIPRGAVRRTIEFELARRLSDLVERRLMLLYSPDLTRKTLTDLAGLLVQAGKLTATEAPAAVEAYAAELAARYGRKL
jgi:glycerol-3-phosphate dehydrogenase